ncbi:MAG: bifunctional pyr operon transcriptional regulator/uracil phosphoribosyltransferase PyrR [Actinomycetota bacterium]
MAPEPTTTTRGSARSVLDEADIRRAVTRISHEIIERTKGAHDVVILGIPRRGTDLAARIAESVATIAGLPQIACGVLDVSAYRDDSRLRQAHPTQSTSIPVGGIEAKTVVLVDDVFFSGRTTRAALTALDDIGRPAAVQLAVLIDRGHRELPIRADYVGKNIPTAMHEEVVVRTLETDGVDEVLIADVERAEGIA